ncbi:unnamed protein product [Symbiodinium microadriaticum]|nr:unnamed protein product [Symbiodinium microadriaticum]
MSGASESGATAVTRTKDGIPCWSGEAATCVQYEEASLLWEQSLTWEKRYTAGPKLVQELTGAARRFVAGQSAGWVAYRGGVRVLMDHLRRALGKPRVNEVTDLLATYFKGTRRKANESMNEYITRKTEAYMRASQALKRVQPHYERDDQGRPGGTWTSSRRSSYEAPTSWSRQWTPANEEPAAAAGEAEASTEATDTPAGERDQWSGQWSTWGPTSWSSYSWQWRGSWGYPGDWGDRSSSGGSVLGETSTGLPELLPAFIQGWYLLADSNLDHAEKNIVLTALGGDFTPQKVAQELRNQFPEGEVRRRDQRRYQSYIGEAAEVSEDEEGDAMGFSLQELTEGGMTEEGIAMVVDCEETAREALAALHQAKRTLKEARQKQHFVKQSRRYYQGGSSSTSSTAPRARDDSNIDCLRCGKRGHRAANCPMKPLAAQAEATTDGDDNGRQQAPFVCYSDTAPGTTDFSETYNMHDISDSLFDNAACLAGFAQSQESEAAWSVTAAGTGLTTSGAVAAGMIYANLVAAILVLKQTPSVTHLLATFAMDNMTKGELVLHLRSLGEEPPRGWTRMELRQRLADMAEQGEVAIETGKKAKTALQNAVVDLNRASQRKATLVAHVKETYGLKVGPNDTIAIIQKNCMNHLIRTIEAEDEDVMGFGKYAAKTYIHVLETDAQYCEWAKTTSREDSCSCYLRRFVTWMENRTTMEMEPKKKIVVVKKKGTKMSSGYTEEKPPPVTQPSTSMSSSSSSTAVVETAVAQLAQMVATLTEEVKTMKADRPDKTRKVPTKHDEEMPNQDRS